jgi:hypothetical protein
MIHNIRTAFCKKDMFEGCLFVIYSPHTSCRRSTETFQYFA